MFWLRDAIRLFLRLIPRGTVVRVLRGPLRGKRWIVGAATHGCWVGSYERQVQDVFVRHVAPGAVVYDVGANAGFFTLLAASLVGPAGKVFAFEPLERNLWYLHEHLRLNRVTNVRVFPVAVTDLDGSVRFAAAADPAMGGVAAEGDREVPSVTLDSIANVADVPLPAFIKMDIEGGEHSALSGAGEILRVARPTILLSEHGWRQHELCSELLKAFGYEIEVLVDGAYDGNYIVLAMHDQLKMQ